MAILIQLALPAKYGLSTSHFKELLEIPLSRYQEVKMDERELLCYRTSHLVWGKERTVVLYLSETLRQGQIRGLTQTLRKSTRN